MWWLVWVGGWHPLTWMCIQQWFFKLTENSTLHFEPCTAVSAGFSPPELELKGACLGNVPVKVFWGWSPYSTALHYAMLYHSTVNTQECTTTVEIYKCMLRLYSVSHRKLVIVVVGTQFVVVSGSWKGYIRRLNSCSTIVTCRTKEMLYFQEVWTVSCVC